MQFTTELIPFFEIKHNKHHIWRHHNLEVGVFKLAREMEREEEEKKEL